jgi:hypothetical protein
MERSVLRFDRVDRSANVATSDGHAKEAFVLVVGLL